MFFLIIEATNACQPKIAPSTTATASTTMRSGLIIPWNLTGVPSRGVAGCMMFAQILKGKRLN